MGAPQGVWRQSLEPLESHQLMTNLLNLNCWPSWHSSAGRILSQQNGDLVEGQQFDLHRVERQRLIEEMWVVHSIRQSKAPRFLEVEFNWCGQQREGRPLGTAIANLRLAVTVWGEDDAGVEIAAWWNVRWWARFMRGRVNRLPRALAKQWLKDASLHGILPIPESLRAGFDESE